MKCSKTLQLPPKPLLLSPWSEPTARGARTGLAWVTFVTSSRSMVDCVRMLEFVGWYLSIESSSESTWYYHNSQTPDAAPTIVAQLGVPVLNVYMLINIPDQLVSAREIVCFGWEDVSQNAKSVSKSKNSPWEQRSGVQVAPVPLSGDEEKKVQDVVSCLVWRICGADIDTTWGICVAKGFVIRAKANLRRCHLWVSGKNLSRFIALLYQKTRCNQEERE